MSRLRCNFAEFFTAALVEENMSFRITENNISTGDTGKAGIDFIRGLPHIDTERGDGRVIGDLPFFFAIMEENFTPAANIFHIYNIPVLI